MNDHTIEVLSTVALLAFNGRSLEDIAKVVLANIPEDRRWDFWRELNEQMHVVPVYSLCAAAVRQQLMGVYSGNDYDERFTGTDEELFEVLDKMVVPDAISETMMYCLEDVLDGLRGEGKIVKVESKDELGPG